MDPSHLTESEVDEQIESIMERIVEDGDPFHVNLHGTPYSTVESLRFALRSATPHTKLDARKQLAEIEGRLIHKQREREERRERDEAEAKKHGPMTFEEETDRRDFLAHAKEISERESSTESRLGRIEAVLERIAKGLEQRG